MKWRKDIPRPYTYLGFTFEFSEYYDDPTVRRKQTTYGARYDPDFEERLKVLQDDAVFDQMLHSRGGRYDNTIDRYFAIREFYDSVDNSSPEYWMSTHPVLPPKSWDTAAVDITPTLIRNEIRVNRSYRDVYLRVVKVVSPIAGRYDRRRKHLLAELAALKSRYSIITDVDFRSNELDRPKWISKNQTTAEGLEDRLMTLLLKYGKSDIEKVHEFPDDFYRQYAESLMVPYFQKLDQFEWDLEDMELRARNYFNTTHAHALGTITRRKLDEQFSQARMWQLLGESTKGGKNFSVTKNGAAQYRIHISDCRKTNGDLPDWIYGVLNYMLRVVGWENIYRYSIHSPAEWVPDWKTTEVFCRILGQILERNSPNYRGPNEWSKVFQFDINFYVPEDIGKCIQKKLSLVREYNKFLVKFRNKPNGEQFITKIETMMDAAVNILDYSKDIEVCQEIHTAYNTLYAEEIAAEKARKAEEAARRLAEQKREAEERAARLKEQEEQRRRALEEERLAKEEALRRLNLEYEVATQNGFNLNKTTYANCRARIPGFVDYLHEYWAHEDWRYTSEIHKIVNRLLSENDCDSQGMGCYTADLEFPERNIKYPYAISRVIEESGGVIRLKDVGFTVCGMYNIPNTIAPCVLYAFLRYRATTGCVAIIGIEVDGNIRKAREEITQKLLKGKE